MGISTNGGIQNHPKVSIVNRDTKPFGSIDGQHHVTVVQPLIQVQDSWSRWGHAGAEWRPIGWQMEDLDFQNASVIFQHLLERYFLSIQQGAGGAA